MNDHQLFQLQDQLNRRVFLGGTSSLLGITALGALLNGGARAGEPASSIGSEAIDKLPTDKKIPLGLADLPHFAPKAKRIIYLFQSGAPSQIELFDPKPQMEKQRGKELPNNIRKGQRLTGMTSKQKSFPVAPSIYKFAQHGQSGLWMSELLPHLSKIADELCIIRSMNTEAINHDPAITFMQTGSQLAGRPSIGAWFSYGLGSVNQDLPAYIALTSFGTGRKDDQPIYDRLWGSGFLPSKYQGVKFRNKGEAVLYLGDPPGVDRATRRDTLDRLQALNKKHFNQLNDPEIQTRIAQYEMAFRMQASVPDLLGISNETQETLDMYGPEVKKPGTFASNCLLARRLAERDVRAVQLFHMGWDQHLDLPKAIKGQCYDTDQPTAALIKDLKRLGLLEDTLIVWGGEFGRTIYSQGALTATNYGRDHHPRCYSIFMAGAGIKRGFTIGETDDYSYNITADPVHVHDLNATIMHLMGVDHTKLTYRYQGRDFRLTDIHGELVKKFLA